MIRKDINFFYQFIIFLFLECQKLSSTDTILDKKHFTKKPKTLKLLFTQKQTNKHFFLSVLHFPQQQLFLDVFYKLSVSIISDKTLNLAHKANLKFYTTHYYLSFKKEFWFLFL